MARALQDILTELNNVYDPQRQSINTQIGALDPQQQAEEKGLQAAKTDAFSQITDQANRRGLFYSGIPVAEEQRYTGANFLPAVANLHSRYAQQRFSLQDALNKVTQDQYTQAEGLRQQELDREAQAAAARAASGGGGASPSFGFGGFGGRGSTPAPQQPQQQQYDPNQVRAATSVKSLLSTNNQDLINKTYQAIAKSAGYGNTYDQMKLALLNQLWLGGQPSSNTGSYNKVPMINGQTSF